MGLWLLTLSPHAVQSAPRIKKIPHEVLAFFYGWYGNPQVSGHWVHWKDVDEANKTIASTTHYSQLGPYDSHDP